MAGPRKTSHYLTQEERKKAVQMLDNGSTLGEVERQYNISRSACKRLKKAKNKVLGSQVKKRYPQRFKEVNKGVFKVFQKLRSVGTPVSGPMLQSIAVKQKNDLCAREDVSAAVKKKYEHAVFGNSWLESFKKRHDVRCLRINGERASLPANLEESMAAVRDLILSLSLSAADVFNWDETGLFYKAMPVYTLAARGDTGAGAKEDKARVTLMLCVNGDGSDRSLVMVGKSKTPRGTSSSFWDEKGIEYHHNESAWMTRELFSTLLKKFDDRIERPVILLIDNFRGHEFSEMELRHVIPVFLPPNSTAKTQPLDAGIIAAFKVRYRSLLMDWVCSNIASFRKTRSLSKRQRRGFNLPSSLSVQQPSHAASTKH